MPVKKILKKKKVVSHKTTAKKKTTRKIARKSTNVTLPSES